MGSISAAETFTSALPFVLTDPAQGAAVGQTEAGQQFGQLLAGLTPEAPMQDLADAETLTPELPPASTLATEGRPPLPVPVQATTSETAPATPASLHLSAAPQPAPSASPEPLSVSGFRLNRSSTAVSDLLPARTHEQRRETFAELAEPSVALTSKSSLTGETVTDRLRSSGKQVPLPDAESRDAEVASAPTPADLPIPAVIQLPSPQPIQAASVPPAEAVKAPMQVAAAAAPTAPGELVTAPEATMSQISRVTPQTIAQASATSATPTETASVAVKTASDAFSQAARDTFRDTRGQVQSRPERVTAEPGVRSVTDTPALALTRQAEVASFAQVLHHAAASDEHQAVLPETVTSSPSLALASAAATSFADSLTRVATQPTTLNPQTLQLSLPQPPLQSPSWSQAAGERIAWMVQGEHPAALLEVSPDSLGPIQVRVELKEQGAQISLSAHQAVTASLLESHLPRLTAALEGQGVRVDQVAVSQQGFSSAFTQDGSGSWNQTAAQNSGDGSAGGQGGRGQPGRSDARQQPDATPTRQPASSQDDRQLSAYA